MKRRNIIILLFLACGVALAAGVTERFPADVIQFGKNSSTDNKQIIFDTGLGVNNPSITVDGSGGNFVEINKQFNVVDDLFKFGSGATGDQVMEFDIGSGASNPKFKWEQSLSSFSFSNDGLNFKKLGSGSGGGGGGVNALAENNFDFETGSPPTDFVANGGSLVAATATPIFGEQSGAYTATAIGHFLDSAAGPITFGFVDQTCQAEIFYHYPTGADADYKMQVIQFDDSGAAEVLVTELDLDVTTKPRKAHLVFSCPDDQADTLKIRIISNVASPNAIELDQYFVGTGRNTIAISQAEEYGSAHWAPVLNCAWITNSTVATHWALFDNVDSDCNNPTTTGKAIPNPTKIPVLRLERLIPGRYRVAFRGRMVNSGATGSVGVMAVYTSWDGGILEGRYFMRDTSTQFGVNFIEATFTVTETIENPFIGIAAQGVSGTSSHQLISSEATQDEDSFIATIYRYPLESSEALTLETTGGYVQASFTTTGGNVPLPTVTSAFPSINFSTGAVVNYGTLDAGIACLGVDGNGEDCNTEGVNEVVGITFKPHVPGDWMVCTTILQDNSGAGSTNGALSDWYLAETSLDGNSTIRRSPAIVRNRDTVSTAGGSQGFRHSNDLCGIFSLNDTAKRRFEIDLNQQVVGTMGGNQLLVGGGAVAGTAQMTWWAYPITQQFPQPIFTDLKDTLDQSVQMAVPNRKIKKLMFRGICSGSSVIDATVGFASIGNISAGDCQILFDPSVPDNTSPGVDWLGCHVNPNSTAPVALYGTSPSPANGVTVGCKIASSGADCTSFSFNVSCHYEEL